ncbi:hypothetical protein [Sphingobacterium siyangense]|uniref:hypothetical protein n=1 Tax=Sphingobacterium siyangense TaxID=459529 RepID=UPI00301736C6
MYGYTLNGKSFNSFGIIESQIASGNIALEGAWDMPARIGKIFHDWGDEDGIEPYLRSDEIFLGGRDIKFLGFMKSESRESAIEALDAFFSHIDPSKLMVLSGQLGTWNVYVSSDIKIEYYYGANIAVIEFTFREPVASFQDAVLPVADNKHDSIDNISWESIGVKLMTFKNDLNRPAPKSQTLTSYGVERYEGAKRGFRELEFSGIIVQPDFNAFKIVLNRLYKLFKAPNARTLRMKDGTVREVFVKDGFKVVNIIIEDDRVLGQIDIKFCEIRQLQNWNKLTDSSGLILVDKYGQPISEISKKF